MAQVDVIGRPLQIGGNTAQLTTNGKVKITDANGKTKVISQKSFQKQLIKNADKINNGDSFEFKSNSTGKKVAAGIGIAGAIAGITAAVIYRKNIGNFFKNINFKELKNDLMERGQKLWSSGIENGKKLWERAKNAGKNIFEYIKDIPNKFSKTTMHAAENNVQ